MKLDNIIRPSILNLKPYSSARDEFDANAEVYLDANESPYPTDFNRYPDPHQIQLKSKINELKNVPVDSVFIGNGSDEAIDLIIRACCEPGKESILITEPTYGMYRVCADINNVSVISVPLTVNFDVDIVSMKAAINDSVKIIFVCSPNNPSGNSLTRSKIQELLVSFDGLVVVDEAYIDFSETKSFLNDLPAYDNLLVLQTFSKAWGLAGLRVGMCFGAPELIGILNKIKYPYNISSAVQSMLLHRINDEPDIHGAVQEITTEKQKLTTALGRLQVVEHVYPSDANFLLVRFARAREIYQYLVKKGVIVRDRSTTPGCKDCLRITIGTPGENTRLLIELKNYEKSIVY